MVSGDWTYAEYAKVPLENCTALDGEGLLGLVRDGGLGYNVEAPSYISTLLVPFGKGGLRYGMSYWCGLR